MSVSSPVVFLGAMMHTFPFAASSWHVGHRGCTFPHADEIALPQPDTFFQCAGRFSRPVSAIEHSPGVLLKLKPHARIPIPKLYPPEPVGQCSIVIRYSVYFIRLAHVWYGTGCFHDVVVIFFHIFFGKVSGFSAQRIFCDHKHFHGVALQCFKVQWIFSPLVAQYAVNIIQINIGMMKQKLCKLIYCLRRAYCV